MSVIILPELERYLPVGRCICCGRARPEMALEEEHIIPLAINGGLILPDASCRRCAESSTRDPSETFSKEW